ncbi:right-handed parallel beta-helix repeat-containing protein [Sulfitobacter sp. 915]|uniref:right-handed parallel beta-helix repeat-containing protein n=1 Tax=Sulfitobacter sp. 915 TaxID=3368558 RepID=UPI003745E6F1
MTGSVEVFVEQSGDVIVDVSPVGSKGDIGIGIKSIVFDEVTGRWTVTLTNDVEYETGSVTEALETYESNAAASASAAATQAGIATTQAGIATTRAGEAAGSASTATTQAGIATGAAGTATTQAGIATTQAGIATTKASESDGSAQLSQDWAEKTSEPAGPDTMSSRTAAEIAIYSALSSQDWAEGTEPGDPGTKSSKVWALESSDAADAAATSAAQAALYDGPKFNTIALMAANDALTDGKQCVVWDGFNGEPETFVYDEASTVTADGALVVDAAGMGAGRLVSKRTTFATVADMLADRRTLAAGTKLTAAGFLYKATDSTGNLGQTTAGGQELDVLPIWAGATGGIHLAAAFGVVADGVTDDTAAAKAAFAATTCHLTLPAGVMVVSDTLVANAYTTIDGLGYGSEQSTIKQADGANLSTPLVANAAWYNNASAPGGPTTIENLFIDGNRDNNTGFCSGIVLMSFQSRVEGCNIFKCTGHGIHFADQNRAGTNAVGGGAENCAFKNRVTRCGGDGISVDDNTNANTDLQIRENIIGIVDGNGILSRSGSKVQNNHVYDTGLDGIAERDGFDSIIAGNSIQDWGQSATSGTRRGIAIFGQAAERPSMVSGNNLRLVNEVAGSTYYPFAVTFPAGVTTATGRATVKGNTANMPDDSMSLVVTGSGQGTVYFTGNDVFGLKRDHVSAGANVVVHRRNDSDRVFRDLAGNATPSVLHGSNFQTSANFITYSDFTGGFDGQEIFFYVAHANTTIDFTGTNLKGNAGVDWTPAIGDHMRCVHRAGVWLCEVSDNTA